MGKSNEAVAKMFLKLVWQTQSYNLLKEYVSPDFQYHTTFNERVLNLDEYIAYVKVFHEAMPDLELTIEDVLVKGDKAVVHSIVIGTITKPLFGVQPSDKLLSFSAMSTIEFEHGKIRELDTLTDMAGVQRQLEKPVDNEFPIDKIIKEKVKN